MTSVLYITFDLAPEPDDAGWVAAPVLPEGESASPALALEFVRLDFPSPFGAPAHLLNDPPSRAPEPPPA